MEMNTDLACRNCVRDIYRAIGGFLTQDKWLSQIVSVDVFVAGDDFGASVEWDVHPCREQIALFRQVWREETNPTMGDIVITHDALSSIVDDPRSSCERGCRNEY